MCVKNEQKSKQICPCKMSISGHFLHRHPQFISVKGVLMMLRWVWTGNPLTRAVQRLENTRLNLSSCLLSAQGVTFPWLSSVPHYGLYCGEHGKVLYGDIQPSAPRAALEIWYWHTCKIYIQLPAYLCFHLVINNPEGNEAVPRGRADEETSGVEIRAHAGFIWLCRRRMTSTPSVDWKKDYTSMTVSFPLALTPSFPS